MTWGLGAAFAPLLETWARHKNATVLDPAPATLSRRDATEDGIHYGRSRDEVTAADAFRGVSRDISQDIGSVNVALVAKLYRLIVDNAP